MNKIVILDFQSGIVYVREVSKESQVDESEDIMAYYADKLGLHADDCQYMLTDSELDIKIA